MLYMRLSLFSALFFIVGLLGLADSEKDVSTTQISVIQLKNDGSIDWSQNEISARGIGLSPVNEKDAAKVRVLAREAAITVAARNLVKIIHGVEIDSNQTVENLMLVNDTIKTKVEGMVKGAVIKQEKDLGDGSYEVVMSVKIYGKAGLSECISFNNKVTDTVLEYNPKAVVLNISHEKSVETDVVEWTGIIIDCRGKKLLPTMEPCVLDTADTLIYPNNQIPKDYNMANGLVSYYTTVDAAIASRRVGVKPLVVKAIEVKGSNHPIISIEDALRINTVDKECKIRSTFAVSFLLD
ncbi:MAG: hypothetical protein WCO98_16680 [bacterium]